MVDNAVNIMVNEHKNLHFLVAIILSHYLYHVKKYHVPGNTYLAFNFTA